MGRAGLWVKDVISVWNSFEFEMYVKHLSGEAEWAVGYRHLEFRGEVWAEH